jgi:MFS transporter, CP family, cyanate transporter
MTSSSPVSDKSVSVGAAYCVIFSGVVAALQIGKLPPALPELSQTLGLSLMQAGFLLSLVQLAGMSLALAVGLSADGFGLKRSMLLGLVILGVASAMGAAAESATSLMVWRAVEGFGFLAVTLPAPGLIRKLVSEHHLRKLLGYWGAYMPAGTALTLLAGPLWLPEFGWRTWWLLFAVLSWVMAFVLWRVVPTDVSTFSGLEPAQASSLKTVAWTQRLRETLSAPGPWWRGTLLCHVFWPVAGGGGVLAIHLHPGWLVGCHFGLVNGGGCSCQHGGQHGLRAFVAKGYSSQRVVGHGILVNGGWRFFGICRVHPKLARFALRWRVAFFSLWWLGSWHFIFFGSSFGAA